MDPKTIFIACRHMFGRVKWEMHEGNEWSLIGDGPDFRMIEAQRMVSETFPEDEIYLVIDRHNAFSVLTASAAAEVKKAFADRDVILCDKTFKKMIFFSYLGVVKRGAVES